MAIIFYHTSIQENKRGFALYIAVIFMSVMLTFGLQLASLGFKQQQLTASTISSQYAFYAADTALECALTADQMQNLFAYTDPGPTDGSGFKINCDGQTVSNPAINWNTARIRITQTISLDGNTRCADVMVVKESPSAGGHTTIYSQGYSVPCSVVTSPGGVPFAYRGLKASY